MMSAGWEGSIALWSGWSFGWFRSVSCQMTKRVSVCQYECVRMEMKPTPADKALWSNGGSGLGSILSSGDVVNMEIIDNSSILD